MEYKDFATLMADVDKVFSTWDKVMSGEMSAVPVDPRNYWAEEQAFCFRS